MRLLGFDTSTRATSVAIWHPGLQAAPLELRDDPPAGDRPNHARRLLPLASQALALAGVDWADLDRVVVGRGPGTFTGLRIGISTARALATALQLPLVGVATLQSLATAALAGGQAGHGCSDAGSPVLALLDARRKEVFAAAWSTDPGAIPGAAPALAETLLPPQALRPEALAAVLAGWEGRPLAVGEGAVAFREILERAGAAVPPDQWGLHRVSAAWHCRLAQADPGERPDEVTPEYLRLPDAEIARQAANRDAPAV